MTIRNHPLLQILLCLLAAALGSTAVNAQIPKGIGLGKPKVARPEGAWRGTASETLEDGSKVEYPLELEFSGSDEALQLAVRASAKVPAGGQTLTVSIAARYSGTFAERKVSMRSESIQIRVLETGESVPSAPQRIEASLEDGVLNGRVGNDDDGWSTFTAKPQAGIIGGKTGEGEIVVPAAPRLVGNWSGNASERIENGSQVDYPVELTFAGSDDALQLTVNGTAKVPANGQTLTVKIVGRYSGSFRDGSLTMRSESIDVRVVETGQTIPSAPQQVTGRLDNDVLTGRVGSDGDGWTTFTVRRTGGPTPQPIPAPAPIVQTGYAGTWRGTSRERGPDGREFSYPITIVFTGVETDMRAEVSANLDYPTQDGKQTPIEYRATFRGSVRGSRLQMNSDRVRVRFPEHNREQDAPQQQLAGSIENGVFLGTVGDGGPDSSRVELRRQGGTTTGVDVIEEVTPTPSPAPTPVPTPGRSGSAYGTIVLERREIRDQACGGVPSHTMSAPVGWRFQGGPVWTGNPDHILDFAGDLVGSDGESLHFRPDLAFSYSRVQSQFGSSDDNNGQQRPDGSIARMPPQQPGEVESQVIVPRFRPNATDIRLVAAERLPKLEAALADELKAQLEMMRSLMESSRTTGGVQSDGQTWMAVERARVTYVEDGIEWEEEFQCTLTGYHGTVATEGMRSELGSWSVSRIRSGRARKDRLDGRLALLWMCADSVREQPRWSASVNELRLELMRAKTAAMRNQTGLQIGQLQEIYRRGQEAAKTRSEISDMQMATWRSTQDSLDRAHVANVDALGERQDFRSADGNLHTVTNHFDRAFKDHNDRVILTNDPNYRPAADGRVNQVTWEEMQRVDPFHSGR